MSENGWNQEVSPYHPGEEELHARLGRKDYQETVARQIHRPVLLQQHQDFYSALPFIFVGSIDSTGAPWASILYGAPGFISSPDNKNMVINASVIPGDPLSENLTQGNPIGLVGVELTTRRRNRMNGIVKAHDQHSVSIGVVQSYGNCPQYIQTREMDYDADSALAPTPETDTFTDLDGEAKALIAKSDTLFVASHNNRDDQLVNGGADMSHRGGKPGFVKVEGNTLTVPDYLGNFAFNTLGNFLVNPKGGLLFIDFDNGDLLQVTGSVEILWDKDEEISAFQGAERAWRLQVERAVRIKHALPMQWVFKENSPVTELTGSWQQAASTLAAEAKRNAWRAFKLTRRVVESNSITSFYFAPSDGDGTVDYCPGQFLTIKANIASDKPEVRTYTLSSAPSDAEYRISVKRETGDPENNIPAGKMSNFLHDSLSVGDTIEARAPRGDFWMDTADRAPALLLAAGVGITPFVSMINQVLNDSISKRHLRPITIVHSVRTTQERAFAKELLQLAVQSHGLVQYQSVVSRPAADEKEGQHFSASGRISQAMLEPLLDDESLECYLCGPAAFMQSMYDILVEAGISDKRINAESFGPSALVRQTDGKNTSGKPLATKAQVQFSSSDIKANWTIEHGNLLQFAESQGLNPLYGCRSGACGTCATHVVSGNVDYLYDPKLPTESGVALICCAVPAESDEPLVLDM